jgi:hypothetical protein
VVLCELKHPFLFTEWNILSTRENIVVYESEICRYEHVISKPVIFVPLLTINISPATPRCV